MGYGSGCVAMCIEKSDELVSPTEDPQTQAAYDTGVLKMTAPTLSDYVTV